MGNKSKFTFPMPGRSARPQVPIVSISTPLTKAQKVLGTEGGISIDAPSVSKEPIRSWETSSAGGISISVSEGSASQISTNDTGLGLIDEDGEQTPGTSYGRGMWEQESEIIPRQLRSAHGPGRKGLSGKKSAATIGADYRDGMTDDTFARRRDSTSTIWTHYESSKMPLAISQQTSNSAMAKGLPAKISDMLDMDGTLAGAQQKKKKPARLDLSILRPRSRKNNGKSPEIGPVLGNGYVMRSPSTVSVSPMSTSSSQARQHSIARIITKHQNSSANLTVPTPESGRSRRTPDMTGLHQLYDHYEQMSFRDNPTLHEETEDGEAQEDSDPDRVSFLIRKKSSATSGFHFTTPLSNPYIRETGAHGNRPRDASNESKATATYSDTVNPSQTRPASKKSYAASVSSRHTRTSKASPSTRSILESDRQQNSVLSLTDSDTDEDDVIDSRSMSAAPYQTNNPSRDDLSVSSDRRQSNGNRSDAYLSQRRSTSSKESSYAPLNEFLTVPHGSPKSGGHRSPPNNPYRSNHSSGNTVTYQQYNAAYSKVDHRLSVQSNGTWGSAGSGSVRRPSDGVQGSKAAPYPPTADHLTVPIPQTPINMDQILLRPTVYQRDSRQGSQTLDQPTPPVSPNSMEFCMRPSESKKNSTTEAYNARMMAVTRQEELLLAALRKKRARMRENIIAEIEEDRTGQLSGSSGGSGGIDSMLVDMQQPKPTKDARGHLGPTGFPQRSSSLARRTEKQERARQTDRMSKPEEARHSNSREDQLPTVPEAVTPATSQARHERVLLYLDQPLDEADPIDTAEPSPDLSEFMESEIEWPLPKRQSRSRTRPDQQQKSFPPSSHRFSERPRPDSSPLSPRSQSLVSPSALSDVPETHEADHRARHHHHHQRPETAVYDEDVDADDMSLDDLDEVVGHRHEDHAGWGHHDASHKPSGIARADSPISPLADELLAPNTFIPSASTKDGKGHGHGHVRGKKSAAVRLSAVGRGDGTMPWWGDDD
ncbi:hypothetical protein F4778DRAFT_527463 [Xylariomycetidae sp. FL2044]|nr:hypothetical protein F4778DRAFT_527463 [Xylariomycetidae sp. FL2044]